MEISSLRVSSRSNELVLTDWCVFSRMKCFLYNVMWIGCLSHPSAVTDASSKVNKVDCGHIIEGWGEYLLNRASDVI